MRHAICFISAPIVLVLGLFIVDGDALAGERGERGEGRIRREHTRTGPEGRSWRKQVETRKTGERAYQRDTSVTGPEGRERSRSAAGEWDAETDTWSKSVTKDGPEGNTRSRESEITHLEGGSERSTTFTGNDGEQATRETTVARDAETGELSKEVTWTGPEGQTGSRESQTERTEEGVSHTTTLNRRDGQSVTVEKSVSLLDPEETEQE